MESDHRPVGNTRETTARIDRGHRHQGERLAKQQSSTRAVFARTVDNLPPADGIASCYRPRELPANQQFTTGAGDTGGIYWTSVAKGASSSHKATCART
jgi:hypothetical protein